MPLNAKQFLMEKLRKDNGHRFSDFTLEMVKKAAQKSEFLGLCNLLFLCLGQDQPDLEKVYHYSQRWCKFFVNLDKMQAKFHPILVEKCVSLQFHTLVQALLPIS